MITIEKTTSKLLEDIKYLPESKLIQVSEFVNFLIWQTEKEEAILDSNIDNNNELTLEDIKEGFGMWKERSITKEDLRKKTWRDGK